MMPPTSIDGTDITGATIDGTDVQEITVDGQTVFSATPDFLDNFETQPVGPYATNSSSLLDAWNHTTSNTGNITRSTNDPHTGSFHLLYSGTTTGQEIAADDTVLRLPQIGDTIEMYHKINFSSGGGFAVKINNNLDLINAPWLDVGYSYLQTYRRYIITFNQNNADIIIDDGGGNVEFTDTVSYSISNINNFVLRFNVFSGAHNHKMDDIVFL